MNQFAKNLIDWYRKNARPLPWRKTRDPYKIWVSEIILQQTQVAVAIPYYKRFVQQFPTIERLASARESDVLKAWEGLGYYARARNLRKGAQFLVQQYNGKLPHHPEELKKIHGIGPYIASAIASLAFNHPAAILEGNVKRIFARLLAIRKPIDLPPVQEMIFQNVSKLLPRRSPALFNQALMELGQVICTPQSPRCSICPIQQHCKAEKLGIQNELPIRNPKKQKPLHHRFAWIAWKDGKLLIEQRPSHGLLGGLWQIPLYSRRPSQGTRVGYVHKTYSHFEEKIEIFRIQESGDRRLTSKRGTKETKWIRPQETSDYALTGASHKILEMAGIKFKPTSL